MTRPRQPPSEFLAQVLTRRGTPDDLPYTNEAVWLIRQHLLDAVQDFPSLTLKVQKYTHTDGTTVPLLMADGTLPMYYQGVKYNIPVSLWLPERYPNLAPIMYVVPTPDMIIKPRHAFVDASGVDPPLFSKPPGWVPPGPTQSHQQSPQRPVQQPSRAQSPANQQAEHHHHTFQAENPMIRTHTPPPGPSGQAPVNYAPANIWGGAMAAHQAASAGGSHTSNPNPTPSTSSYQSPPPPPPQSFGHQQHQQQQPQQQAQQQQSDPSAAVISAAFRKAALAALTKRLQSSVAAATSAAGSELDSLFSIQAQLTQRGGEVQRGVAALQREREALEAAVLDMAGKTVALDRWLADNEAKIPEGEVDADTAIVAADPLCQQALECQAEDMAIEDTLYALERALTDGHLPADTYLKQVRSLCRKQFFVRALGMKVATRQHKHATASSQGSTLSPYAPPPDRGVHMTQGDSWANTGILPNPLAAQRS
ncbi:hypothetical protein WJX77_000858 [Trebouxia sp. C0004]